MRLISEKIAQQIERIKELSVDLFVDLSFE
jgi:hypothetical protein